MIDSRAALEDVVALILEQGSVALDTEFFWERTFYPRLGVVQLGLPDGSCRLVDAPAIGGFEPGGLQPLGRLLGSRKVQKILHDAPQDLMILNRASGVVPRNIFDTRYAAGFAGLSSTTSLGNLLADLFEIHLPKTETRADWLHRPLTERQVAYAEDDVRYLHAARDDLLRRATARGTACWLTEELASFDDSSAYADRDPSQQYKRMKGIGRLASRELAVLRELTAWREETARRRDRPRGRVLADKTLIHLARTQPRTMQALTGSGRVSDRTARRSGTAILQAVETGLALNQQDCPPRTSNHRAAALSGPLVEQALELMRRAADQKGIDPTLVAPRAEVKALLAAGSGARPGDHRLLRGWRKKFVGRDLLGLLRRFEESEN
jgi:ribonuclease D